MKVLIGILLICFTFTACQKQRDVALEEAGLEKAISAFYQAIEEGDFNKRIGLFSENFIALPNGGQLIQGKDVVKERWGAYQDAIFRIRDLKRIESRISGDIAYTVNEYYYTYHNKGEEPTWHKTKNVHIWERQNDGTWKLHVDIWNSTRE